MTSVYDHPDWAGFVAAIRANPADDTPRLVAADWLDEHGEGDRAELVRVMCAVSPSGRRACHDARTRAHQRAKELLTAHRPLPGVQFRRLYLGYYATAPEGRVRLWFGRGFADEAEAPADWWLTYGDAVLAREPVERVTLTSYPPFYWFMNNLPPNWPAGGRHSPVERPVALDALEHCWPGVAFTLLPEPVQRWQVTEPDGTDASSADWLARHIRDAVARGAAEHIDRQFRAG